MISVSRQGFFILFDKYYECDIDFYSQVQQTLLTILRISHRPCVKVISY